MRHGKVIETIKEVTDKEGRVWSPQDIYIQSKLKSPDRKAKCKKCAAKQKVE